MGPGHLTSTIDQACALARAGVAVHWLWPKTKKPREDAWGKEPVHTVETLKRSYQTGNNLGIRLGEFSKIGDLFLQVIDLDINVETTVAEAMAKLRELIPELDTLPFVISGSGGSSRHFYFLTDRPFTSKKLAKSDIKVEMGGRIKRAWEIELFGTRKQVAAPPSIHPDTGNPYVWGRKIDWDLVDMGLGPVISADRVESWLPKIELPTAAGHEGALDGDAYERLNTLALANIPAWAPLLYPLGEVSTDNGWRITSEELGRKYEESLVIHPKGVQDFGPEAPMTPIWLIRRDFKMVGDEIEPHQVVDWEEESRKPIGMDRDEAAKWLAERLGLDFDVMKTDDLEFEEVDEDDDEDPTGAAFDAEIDDLLSDKPAATEEKAEDPEFEEEDPRWRERLDRADTGAIKPTLHNVELIIRNDPRTRGLARMNEFTQEIVQTTVPGKLRMRKEGPKGTRQLTGVVWNVEDKVNGDLWVDSKDNALRSVLEAPGRQGGWGLKVSDRDMKAAIELSSRASSFHPIREYLKALKWDGVDRVETLFVRFLGAPDNAYTRSISRLFMLGAVARVMTPGHKFDFAVILEGVQGKGKTTFIQTMAKHWFAELDGDFHDTKAMIETMQGAWLLEIPELSGFGRADVRVIKAFISRQRDKARLSYARRAQVFPRQCVFMGSTNDDKYLKDDTGGRRFWPIHCTHGEIDIPALRLEVDQLWAQAVVGYAAMRKAQPVGDLPLYLQNKLAQQEAELMQESRRAETVEDNAAGRVDAWLDRPVKSADLFEDADAVETSTPRTEFCLSQIWEEALGRREETYDQRAAQMVGVAVRIALKRRPGWVQTTHPVACGKYGKQRAYRLGNTIRPLRDSFD
jgi:predicted P-loop ATPase